jgi:hypothetical protein
LVLCTAVWLVGFCKQANKIWNSIKSTYILAR